jgi:polysaccharide biosynthesis transport protein
MRPQTPSDSWLEEPRNGHESDFQLGEYLGIVRRRWRVLAALVLLGLVASLLHFFIAPRQYRATTTVQIERRNLLAVVTDTMVQLDGSDSASSAFYQTQFELLQSRGMAERVVRQLNLAQHPDFNPRRAELSASASPSGAGEEDRAALAGLANRLLRSLEVQPVRNTYLVKISYLAPTPQLAAAVANGVAAAFIDWGIETRSDTAGRATSFLSSQIEQLKREIRDKDLALQAYSRTSDLVTGDSGANPILQRLEALNQDYIQAVSERIQTEARYHEVLVAPRETVADTLSAGLVGQLRREQLRREQEYDSKLLTFKPEWPAMVELRSQIERGAEHLREVIAETVEQARRSTQSELQTARRREAVLMRELAGVKEEAMTLSSVAVEYNNLQVEISTRRALLDELLRKQSETEVASRLEGTRESNVRVVDQAVLPGRAFRPTLGRDLGYGLGLGLLLGLGLVILLEYTDRTLKTAEDVERHLGLPALAVIPEVGEGSGGVYLASRGRPVARPRGGRAPGGKLMQKRPAAPVLEIDLLPHTHPRLGISEAYRSLRTALLLSTARQLQVLAVTSAQASEGKTATVANLAVVMAQLGRQVLVVDGDLRKPRLHQVFRLPNRVGLVSHLTGNVEPAEIFLRSEIPGLHVCPSGPVPPNPSELLSSSRMTQLLKLTRARFDFVIVDSPPALAVTDATLIGAQADGVVLCLRAGQVVREDAQETCERLLLAEIKLLGVVLNGYRSMERRYGRYAYPRYGVYQQAASPAAREAPAAAAGGATAAMKPPA